jgi:hypothetical protein
MISGFIVGRRSVGRSLAFAEIDVTDASIKIDHLSSSSRQTINVKFNRQTFQDGVSPLGQNVVSSSSKHLYDDNKLDDPFPTKKSSLPYGAKVELQLGICSQKLTEDDVSPNIQWDVVRWKIIQHPKDLAEQMASLEISHVDSDGPRGKQKGVLMGDGALSCSTYLKIRREQFDRVNREPRNDKPIHVKNKGTNANVAYTISSDEICHGGKHAKAKRAKVFASWILETFIGIPSIADTYCHPCTPSTEEEKEFHTNDASSLNKMHILDVAGGKGHLSLELVLQQMTARKYNSIHHYIASCTIIDPLVRKGDATMRNSRLQKAKCNNQRIPTPAITHLASYFTMDSFNRFDDTSNMLLLGLHPDQCTEDIINVALRSNTSFAVVPCCVYPDLFPNRHYWDNGLSKPMPVRTYDEFLKYLIQKDDGIKMTTLPIEGKNVVLYKVASM